MIFADFIDPNNNGLDIVDVAYGAAALLSVAAIITGIWKAFRRISVAVSLRLTTLMQTAVEPLIDAKLREWTYPIQKHANGGLSLPDVSRKLDRVLAHLGIHNEGQQ